ncbi:MAG: DUF5331 domain-containing protein [Oscillatoria sp. PMC 1051.18]|nr:DUF5331 domain-containing protein [Oscillatoria sp. PMC 1050.18]MEC5028630.1 DUF5331 domain-containing protein [Oscillatoria sp. PMC 1051.18]
MGLLEELKPTLKDKWLDYYQANRSWFRRTKNYKWIVGTPDGGYRPDSYLIIGAVSALEPKVTEILFHFFLVSDNRDRIVEALGLHFDPEKELEKRAAEKAQTAQEEIDDLSSDPELEYLRNLREENNK